MTRNDVTLLAFLDGTPLTSSEQLQVRAYLTHAYAANRTGLTAGAHQVAQAVAALQRHDSRDEVRPGRQPRSRPRKSTVEPWTLTATTKGKTRSFRWFVEVKPETPRKLFGDMAMSPTYYGDGRWRAGALALETVIPFFKGFKELVRT
jgi:hypothetical protein